MTDTDEDFIDIDEDAPATLDPNSRRGVLVVAAKAAEGTALMAEARRYLDQAALAQLVIFEEVSDEGTATIGNIEEFRGHGYRGSDDPAELEDWLASRTRAAGMTTDQPAIVPHGKPMGTTMGHRTKFDDVDAWCRERGLPTWEEWQRSVPLRAAHTRADGWRRIANRDLGSAVRRFARKRAEYWREAAEQLEAEFESSGS